MSSRSPRGRARRTVRELSDPYGNFMLNPLPPESADVCEVCLTFTDGYDTCYRCGHQQRFTDAVLPISYSPHGEQLHHTLAGYKREGDWIPEIQRHFRLDLAAVLWRFLRDHEACVATRVGVSRFDAITTVPSGSAERDRVHPLPEVVGKIVTGTGDRYKRILRRSAKAVEPRLIDREKYESRVPIGGGAMLLVDDTWTTGASAQSATGALLDAGAEAVGVVVIGRHMHDEFGSPKDRRLQALPTPFDWDRCAYCSGS